VEAFTKGGILINFYSTEEMSAILNLNKAQLDYFGWASEIPYKLAEDFLKEDAIHDGEQFVYKNYFTGKNNLIRAVASFNTFAPLPYCTIKRL